MSIFYFGITLSFLVYILSVIVVTPGDLARAIAMNDGDSLFKKFPFDIERGRVLIEVMDYSDPGANPRSSRFLSPPPPERRL
ncbi:hypothetical protein ACHQM5_006317 [Ranunculus cassubicifolius]